MANAMEQALLLPRDMADLRSIKRHEVFLSLKRDLALVSLLNGFLLLKVIIDFSNHYIFYLRLLQVINGHTLHSKFALFFKK